FVPGNDPVAIFDKAGEAIARAREGVGPTLIEIETYRLAGHFMRDADGDRPKGEKDALFAKDPIPRLRDTMLGEGNLTAEDDARITGRARARVDAAIEFARNSDYPAAEEALERVFA